jgi:hypothetical protein
LECEVKKEMSGFCPGMGSEGSWKNHTSPEPSTLGPVVKFNYPLNQQKVEWGTRVSI